MASYAERLMFGDQSPNAGTGFITTGGLDGRKIATFAQPPKPKKKELGQFLQELGLDQSRKITLPGVGTGYYDDLGNVYGQGDNGTWVKTLDQNQFSRLQANRKLSMEEKEKLAKIPEESTYQPPRLLGVPDAPNALGNLPSNVRGKIQEKEYLSGTKTLDTQEREAQPLDAMAGQARRFQELNAKNDTGGFTSLPIVKQIRSLVDPEFQELESISSSLVPKMREPGSGATSDFDAKMFQQATLGVGKRKEANDAIAAALVARSEREKERLAFANRYLMQNKTLRGANEAWSQYINDVPIFDPSSEVPTINKNRITFEQYFSGQKPKPQALPNQRPPLSAFEE
jgi:hypothetical protein